MSNRFEYTAFDKDSQFDQTSIKALVEGLEKVVESRLPNGRYKSLALTALEEFYMWVGKAIRDKQVERETKKG